MAKLKTIYVIQHSHLDVGFTHDQPIVLDLHGKFIEQAIQTCLEDPYAGTDAAFKWTIEGNCFLEKFLENLDKKTLNHFLQLEKQGSIEVCATYANLAPLYDITNLLESFQIALRLREKYGLNISSAMHSDVNGAHWFMTDVLLDLGINGFSMAINNHFGRAPFKRPNTFNWEAPSGRTILAFNGYPYGITGAFGMYEKSTEQFKNMKLPKLLKELDNAGYDLPIFYAQSISVFGDNGSINTSVCRFIDQWNKEGNDIKIKMVTPRVWWKELSNHSKNLPTHRGDWTDFWNFGSGSASRETALCKKNLVRLKEMDALSGTLFNLKNTESFTDTRKSYKSYRNEAWDNQNAYLEHTWGADCGVGNPEIEDSLGMWNHKAHFAYQARSLSLYIRRNAIGEISRMIKGTDPDDILVVNPLGWDRIISGQIPPGVDKVRGDKEDTTSTRHIQDRKTDLDILCDMGSASVFADQFPQSVIKPINVKAFGYKVIKRDQLINVRKNLKTLNDNRIETPNFIIIFDEKKGGISSWFDKRSKVEIINAKSAQRFAGFVYEKVKEGVVPDSRKLLYNADWFHQEFELPDGWNRECPFERDSEQKVVSHIINQMPNGIDVRQTIRLEGYDQELFLEIFIPDYGDFIDVTTRFFGTLRTNPHSLYMTFPFNEELKEVHYDLGGVAIEPGKDQLKGVCADYFTAHNWVNFSNGELNMNVAMPFNPLFMLGDFQFAKAAEQFNLKTPMLLGWLANNYWETNFRAHQPNAITGYYRLQPSLGKYSENGSHKLGLEASHFEPLLQQMGEPRQKGAYLPDEGQFLKLPEQSSNILTLQIKPDESLEKLILTFYNPSDKTEQASCGSGILEIKNAWHCDHTGKPTGKIPVQNGKITFPVSKHRLANILLIL